MTREEILFMSVILSTEKLNRKFKSGNDTVNALKSVSIDIEEGKLTLLKGKSGSGKTTLINLLGAIDMPTEGKIYLQDRDITALRPMERDMLRKKNFGFVFQSGGLVSYMTALENIEVFLRLTGFNQKERRNRAEQCLEMVGLSKRMKHFPEELSGGEQQRVAIARAIANRPLIIFADEPTSALDTTMGLQIVKTFKDLVEKEKVTVVMTSHDPGMVEIADKVFTLEDGEVIE
jgi:putative ABC transport system ATP-binding protein